ncbi:MAG: hypothetical protein Q8926_16625 [Bacteroidota bacterium]|nr:hypothetical protein [Bacteroidota bacterium]
MNGVILFLLALCPFAMQAQQVGSLILIDAENKQTFTVRVGDQLYASSGHGHLVLPHLTDSTYRLNIRFPKKNLEEQVFPVVIHSKDLGFQLKGADSSWVLYNWQTKQTIHPVKESDSSRILDMGIKREDGFSKLMAAVVNDTSVTYNTYKGNGFGKDSSAALRHPANQPQDSTLAVNLPSHSPVEPGGHNKDPSTVNHQPSTVNRQPSTVNRQSSTTTAQPSTIKKLREVNLKISRKMVFLDRGPEGQADTVTLFVYFETDTTLKKQGAAQSLAVKKQAATDSASGNRVQAGNKSQKTAEDACSQLATDEDMEFLRTAILKANTDQEKIAMATGAFTLKCFSVSQIRLLAGLFVSDKSKYRLMEAARLHVADHDHFRELADMYTDKNFQRKFLVMAEKRS